MPPSNINLGGRSIPAGYLVGRISPGTGPQELLSIEDIGRQLVAMAVVPTAGSAASSISIANNRVLGNTSGSTAAASAQALTQPAAGLTITGGTNAFTFALADDLAALEGLGSTGIAVRTAASTWAQRTVTGTASRLAVTNGDGVSGNPTLDIDAAYVGQTSITTLGTVTTGTWNAGSVHLDGDATYGEAVFYVGGVPTGFMGAAASEIYLGSAVNIPVKVYVNDTETASFPSFGGGITLRGSTSGGVTVKTPAVAGTNTITLPAGTTDFSATGGAGQVVKQSSAGAAFTVGTLAITDTTGVLLGANGGTGVANTGKTITLGGNLALSGAFGTTLTVTATTTLTLPTTGTLATLAGTETLTNKTLGATVLPQSGALGSNGRLDLRTASAGIQLVVADATADATNKTGRTGVAHYTNAEEPVTVFVGQSTNTASVISIGGSSGVLNAATNIRFYTAADTTTLAGTVRAEIYPGGDFRQGGGSALATTATDGFMLIATCAGAPTGVPTNAGAGQIPLIFDKTNFQLYAYISGTGWKKSAVWT